MGNASSILAITSKKNFKKVLTNEAKHGIIKTQRNESEEHKMDFYNIDQLNDHAYEQALAENWDYPEAMLEEWPDELWDN